MRILPLQRPLTAIVFVVLLTSCRHSDVVAPEPEVDTLHLSASELLTHDELQLLRIPNIGHHELRILSPTILELEMITSKPEDKAPTDWDFSELKGEDRLPEKTQFQVVVDSKPDAVDYVGFRRRVLYAPLKKRDLRIGAWLILTLDSPVPSGSSVSVTDPDQELWKSDLHFQATASEERWSPAIHVSQAGYDIQLPKRAMVGYYLGSMGEMDLGGVASYQIKDIRTGKSVYSGNLKLRKDVGWTYSMTPYQVVMEADFSGLKAPGLYRLYVTGMGASLPFRIDGAVPALLARTYALGLYHQRCGAANALPFTRFVHQPCHTAPAEVPTPEFSAVERELDSALAHFLDNPRHTAPPLKSIGASLYPFVRTGTIDVSGGHHDAGDYSKYTINSAALIHLLVFAADNFPGAGDLDNLGLPESGDGKSDLLQEAGIEAAFLSKMQDIDGGFYFLVYPRNRKYESDKLPDHGDPQVVFPKTTSVTAAATAALAQIGSSPRFRAEYPAEAARYVQQAIKGWKFLERAWARYGMDGSYQKITNYGDFAMHYDEMAWAAAELYLATGDKSFDTKLEAIYNPSDAGTLHWKWERMFESYGCAARSYAFGARSGRVATSKLSPAYLEKCRNQILLASKDLELWSESSAYGTSFPTATKRFRTAGWYFSTANAFDIAVAYQLEPSERKMSAIAANITYETGCNPVNMMYVTGLGWKRQHEIVHQYAQNDRQLLPPSGLPLGSVQEGFAYLEPYKKELTELSYPSDGAKDDPYPFYDRWGDSFNVRTEFSIPIQGRSLGVLAWLMARSAVSHQGWRTASSAIVGLPKSARTGQKLTARVVATGMNVSDAQIIWESDMVPISTGENCTITPQTRGNHWVEAEAVWPDGRRVSAAWEISIN